MEQEDPVRANVNQWSVERFSKEYWDLKARLQYRDRELWDAKKEIQQREETIKELREDLGSLRVLEAFMRSGVIKDLGLKEDPETQQLLRKFFQINLRRALHRPETLVLSDPTPGAKRSPGAAEGPENERRSRAA